MPVEETGHQVLALRIDDLSVIANVCRDISGRHDRVLVDGNIGGIDLSRHDVHETATSYNSC